MKKILFGLLILCLVFIENTFAQAYKIEIEFKNFKNSGIFLGYHYGDKTFLVDTAKVNDKGIAEFSGKNNLHQGLYFIALPTFSYFDIIIDNNPYFTINTDTTDFTGTLKFINSDVNQKYIDYQRTVIAYYNKIQLLNAKIKENQYPDSNEVWESKFYSLSDKINGIKTTTALENKDNFFGKLLTAMLPVDVPESILESNDDHLINDYYRVHYFDNYDFSDESLLYASVLNNKMSTFFTRIVFSDPDLITEEALKLIDKSKLNSEVYRYVLNYLITMFETTGSYPVEKTFVTIAEKYYLNSDEPWISKSLKQQLQLRVEAIKPTMAGKIAPDMLLFDTNEKELCIHQIHHDFIILYFYDIECGHCGYYTPILHEISQKMKNYDVAFVAVYTESDFDAWKEYTETNGYTDWYNLYDELGDEDMIMKYDIYKTPRIFILDSEYKIIDKDVDIETLDQYLLSLINKKRDQ